MGKERACCCWPYCCWGGAWYCCKAADKPQRRSLGPVGVDDRGKERACCCCCGGGWPYCCCCGGA